MVYLATFIILLYLFFKRSQRAQYQVWRQAVDLGNSILGAPLSTHTASDEIQWAPAPTVSKDEPQLSEEDMKELFKQEYNDLGK